MIFILMNEVLRNFFHGIQYNKYRDDSNALIVGNDRRLRNTSQIIQTSIGGGNARVSALGVASTIANLSQIKNNIYPKLPFLLKKNNNHPEIYKNRILSLKKILKLPKWF